MLRTEEIHIKVDLHSYKVHAYEHPPPLPPPH